MNITITIITATFNNEIIIEKTINSILNQHYKNTEYILIDGGSTDKTLNIIKKYKSQIKHLVSEPDKGIYDAWNKGIKLSSGNWITFLGAGDMLLPDALLNYVEFIKKNPDLDYISSRVEYIDENNRVLKVFGEQWKWPKFQKKMNVAHVGSLHNKSLYTNKLYDLQYKIVSDYELLLRKKNKLKTGFINKTTAQMLSGGLSYSYYAIYESFLARKRTGGRNLVIALMDFIFQVVIYTLSKIKSFLRK